MTLQPPIPTTLIVPTQQTLEIRPCRSIIAGRGYDIPRPIPQEENCSHPRSHLHTASLSLSSLPRSVTPLQVNPPLNTATAPSAGSTNNAKSPPAELPHYNPLRALAPQHLFLNQAVDILKALRRPIVVLSLIPIGIVGSVARVADRVRVPPPHRQRREVAAVIIIYIYIRLRSNYRDDSLILSWVDIVARL